MSLTKMTKKFESGFHLTSL